MNFCIFFDFRDLLAGSCVRACDPFGWLSFDGVLFIFNTIDLAVLHFFTKIDHLLSFPSHVITEWWSIINKKRRMNLKNLSNNFSRIFSSKIRSTVKRLRLFQSNEKRWLLLATDVSITVSSSPLIHLRHGHKVRNVPLWLFHVDCVHSRSIGTKVIAVNALW